MHCRGLTALLAAVFLLACAPPELGAWRQEDSGGPPPMRIPDVVTINKSGGELAGELLKDYRDPESGRTLIAFRSPSGGQFLLEKSRVARAKYQTDLVARDYETRLAAMKDTAEEHFAMSEWLKDKSRLATQRKYHLQRVVDLDPNDEAARKLLGLKKIDNQWVDETALMASRGYVRAGTRWRSLLELDLIAADEKADSERDQAKIAWSRFKQRFAGSSPEAFRNELLRSVTPALVPLLIADLNDEKDPLRRRTLVEAIGTVRSWDAALVLLNISIADSDPALRDLAISLMEQEGFDRTAIAAKASEDYVLQNKNNQIVNLGARVLGELGEPVAILPLIRALQTEHETVIGDSSGRTNAGVNSSGGGGLSLGNTAQKIVQKLNNQDVSTALRVITGRDFRYDTRQWMQWYRDNYTLQASDLRRDR